MVINAEEVLVEGRENMLIDKEKEEQFEIVMTELFKDKLVSQTQEFKDRVNYWFCFHNKHLEVVSKCCEKHGFKDYMVESAKSLIVPIKSISKETHSVLRINHIAIGSADYDRVKFISRELGDVCIAEGANEQVYNEKRFSTFVIDVKYKDIIKPIVKKVLGLNLEHIEFMDITFQEYDIDGLLWFTIDNSTEMRVGDAGAYPLYMHADATSYPSHLLLCYLLECGINHFIFRDRRGKFSIDVRYNISDDKRKSQHGFRLDLNACYRSSWEANLARIFNYLKIPFEFEKQGFDVEYESRGYYYLPDFFLSNNKIIEVKGFWNRESRDKVKGFRETYPDYELLTLDGDMYTTLSRLYSKHIPEWEHDDVHFTKEIIPLIGITQANRREFVKKLKVGDKVQLVREKDNQYDASAIKVLDLNNNHLGYIATGWACIYASKMDIGMTYTGTVKKIEPKVIQLQVIRDNIDEVIVYDFLKEK